MSDYHKSDGHKSDGQKSDGKKSIAQKSILITGCSSGIGLHAALTLKAKGWKVLATARAQSDVEVLQSHGLTSFTLDLADEFSVAEGVAHALSLTGGRLDALFNNGAYACPGAGEDLPRQAYREIFETNFFGTIDLTNRILPSMRANGGGRIVMNSSVLGFAALRYRGAYNATKFALEGLTDTMRLENNDPNLHFVLIEPGPITTKIRENSIPHFEKWVNVKASSHRKIYEKVLIPRLYDDSGKKDRFELGPEAVTEKLIHALEAPRPKIRYFVTTPTYIMHYARKFLPQSWAYALQKRF